MISTFHKDHDTPTDSQVIICITGKSDYIREKLQEIIDQANIHKPIQENSVLGGQGSCQIITPIWDKKPY